MINLHGMSAKQCCEMILGNARLGFATSEDMQTLILNNGGKYFKASNIERRCRESDKIRSKIVKSNGTRFAKYGWAG